MASSPKSPRSPRSNSPVTSIPIAKLKRRASLDGYQYKGEVPSISNVIARKVNWSEYVKEDLFLREDEASLLADIQLAPPADQSALLDENGTQYLETFERACGKITVEETLQVLLCLLSQLIDNNEAFASLVANHHAMFSTLSSILHRTNYTQFTIDVASRVLAVLYAHDDDIVADSKTSTFKDFFNWILKTLNSPASEVQAVSGVLAALKDLLKSDKMKQIFVEERGIRTFASVLSSSKSLNVQLTYNLGFCTWLLSFHEFSYDSFLQSEILDNIVSILRSGPREKVARVFIATLSNLTGKKTFNESFLSIGALKVMRALVSSKSINDEDALQDLESIIKTLEHDLASLSTFEIYQREIISGKLHWTQVHTEKFWKENVLKAEDNEFAVVKSLIRLLEADDVETVAIACYDLGEFARFYPGGKKILARLRGKEKLLLQMSNPSPEIQRQALIAVQKLMVQNWSSLKN